jgi:hypothetical protein
MSRNHLIIGLGGTGGKVLREFRKSIYQEFRRNDPEVANIRYLYVDSSDEMMKLEDATWKTLGENVQLDKRSQLQITGSDLTKILNNLNDFPNIQPWIGNRQQWQDILGSIVGQTLGGQKRRLGRFLFACKSHEFGNQLNQLVGELTTGSESAVTFHVCAGLAGGTGSGSVIDVVSQIRSVYRAPKTFRIVVYALLPEEIPNQNWDTGNYHANGYSAVQELNALSVSALRPNDVASAGERMELEDPINGCYLFTNENENGLKVDVDKQMPQILADFLFQKIISITGGEALKLLEKMENAENGDGTPEKRPGSNVPERSKRFLAFGIKRLAIPESEIREYLTYTFARQAALQLRFNNWEDSLGFRNEPVNADFGEFVRQKETEERWLLTDEHLLLSRGILAEEIKNRKWKPISQEWQDTLPEFVTMVEDSSEQAMWLNELQKLTVQRFDETFRGQGVRKFYETKISARKQHVAEIRHRVEKDLFSDWQNGMKSMYDISQVVSALLVRLTQRLNDAATKLAKAKENAETGETTVSASRTEWTKVGLISSLLGKRKSLLNAHSEFLRDLYIYRTQIEAWGFAQRLLQELISDLNDLQTDVSRCTATLDDAIKDFGIRISERCNDNEQPDLRQSLVRYYNPSRVKEFSRLLEKKEEEQKRQAQLVRTALIEQIGPDPDFAAFNARVSRQRFFDVMEKRCAETSRIAHDSLVAESRDLSPLFGGNVVGRLEREFAGRDADLKRFLNDLVARAGYFIEFDNQEVTRLTPGIASGSPTKVRQFMVIVPKAKEHSDFATKLNKLLKEQFDGSVAVEFIEIEDKPNEITIVGLANLFPARYCKRLRFLKDRYEKRIGRSDNPDRIRLEVHCEGDGTQFPDLFVPDQSEIIGKALPFMMLGKVTGLLAPVKNPTTGTTDLFLIEEDSDGLPQRTKIGRNMVDVFDTLPVLTAQRIEDNVRKLLRTDPYLHVDKRTEMQKGLRDELKSVLTECNENFEDLVYKRFEVATRTAIQLLKS